MKKQASRTYALMEIPYNKECKILMCLDFASTFNDKLFLNLKSSRHLKTQICCLVKDKDHI